MKTFLMLLKSHYQHVLSSVCLSVCSSVHGVEGHLGYRSDGDIPENWGGCGITAGVGADDDDGSDDKDAS